VSQSVLSGFCILVPLVRRRCSGTVVILSEGRELGPSEQYCPSNRVIHCGMEKKDDKCKAKKHPNADPKMKEGITPPNWIRVRGKAAWVVSLDAP
jgi:hypothetical protein